MSLWTPSFFTLVRGQLFFYISLPFFDSLTTPDPYFIYAFLSPFILMDNSSTFLSGFSRDSLDRVPIPFI